MRLHSLVLAPFLLGACFNTEHPEYHPVTSLHYVQTISSPVAVTPAPGQGVYVPAPTPPALMQPPPAPPPPTPPEDFPW
jgi:hypothetical protein